MTTKHYTLIAAVLIIVLLGIFLAISNKSNDMVVENPNEENVLFNISTVTSSTTTISTSSTTTSSATTTRKNATTSLNATTTGSTTINIRQ